MIEFDVWNCIFPAISIYKAEWNILIGNLLVMSRQIMTKTSKYYLVFRISMDDK